MKPTEITGGSQPHLVGTRVDVECQVDAAAFAVCTSRATTAALADGAHTFAARAIDAAGNTDPSPATRAFVVTPSQPPVRCEGKVPTIVGGPGPVVTGTARNDVIVGTAAGQRIDGRGGNDTICAGPGNAGNDLLDEQRFGGAGGDRLSAAPATTACDPPTARTTTSIADPGAIRPRSTASTASGAASALSGYHG